MSIIILTKRMFRGRNTDRTAMRWFDWLLFMILTVNSVRCASTIDTTMKPATSCTLTNITDLQPVKSSCDSGIAYLFIKNSHFDMFPHVFDYFPQLQSIDISSAGVRHIESSTFNLATHLITLDMSESNMRTLAQNLFTRVNNLTSLDVANSSIETVEKYAFNGLSNLKRLDLSGNKIVSLDAHLFQPLSRLQNIRLNDNRIEVIDESVFMHNSQLMYVYLSRNGIIVVDPNAFIHCQVKVLDLGWNHLRDLDMTTMNHLKELIVSDNELTMLNVPSVVEKVHARNNSIVAIHSDEKNELLMLYLSSNHFTNLSSLAVFNKLEFLELSNNHLQTFPFSDVKALTQLKELQLCRNKLAEIKVEDVVANLPNLKFIELSTKHWSNAYIEQLQSDLKNHSIEMGQDRNVIPDADSSVIPTTRPTPVTPRTTASTDQSPPISGNIEKRLNEIRKQVHDVEYRLGANAAADIKKIDDRLADVEDSVVKAGKECDAKLEVLRSSFKVYEVLVILMFACGTSFILYKLVINSKRMLSGMRYRRAQSSEIFSEQDL